MLDDVTPIPFLDLTAQYQRLEEEWLDIIRQTGRAGSFILGPNVTAFEKEFARYVGVKHAIALANGTDALILSLRALNIGPGDEVITTPFTFFATSEAIDIVGATPVFADILADSYCLDPASVNQRITSKTRAILPVHIFGHPAVMTELNSLAKQHGLSVIEDCAQAFGATSDDKFVGSLGDTGCFSFYPTKVLGCYGDGGMLTTNSDAIDARVRRLRNHGASAPFLHAEVGYNSRLDEIQAALLRLKLRSVDKDINSRRDVAQRYSSLLKGTSVRIPVVPDKDRHVFNLYTVRVPRRDEVRDFLTAQRIGSSVCYPQGLHRQQVYAHLGYKRGSLPVCEQATEETLSLPIYPDMPAGHIMRVCETLKQLVSQ